MLQAKENLQHAIEFSHDAQWLFVVSLTFIEQIMQLRNYDGCLLMNGLVNVMMQLRRVGA